MNRLRLKRKVRMGLGVVTPRLGHIVKKIEKLGIDVLMWRAKSVTRRLRPIS